MGKTTIYILSTLQLLQPIKDEVHILVLVHMRELAFQIQKEYERMSKYLPTIQSRAFYGTMNSEILTKELKDAVPRIVVGTPGKLFDLAITQQVLNLSKVKHLILDECQNLLENVEMRTMVQKIFKVTPYDRQVMMFANSLPKPLRRIALRLCESVRNFCH